MKIITTFFCLLFAAISVAQTADTLVTAKNESHIRIPGTPMSVVVPGDYKLSSEFPGFVNRTKNVQIRLEENHNMGFDQRMAALEKSLKQGGMKIVEFRDILFNGYKAKYISTEAGQAIGLSMLVFGDEHFYVQLGGTYPLSDKPAANSIRTAALSSVYENESL